MSIHAQSVGEAWWQLTLAEQLGNVGSEVSRSLAAKKRGMNERFDGAFARLLELLDNTIADPKYRHSPKRKELCRLREVVCDALYGENLYGSTDKTLLGYFDRFALAARR